jgi:DNA invertase Pin-like site-specific DNA recombinase
MRRPRPRKPAGGKCRLNAALEAGDVVVIVRTDRAFRRASDALLRMKVWQARGVFFHCAENGMNTADATGRLCISMMALGAQWENEVRTQRIAEVRAYLLDNGHWAKHPPFGYKNVRLHNRKIKLMPDVEQRRMAAQFVKWQDEGWSYMDIWRYMMEKRIAPVGRVRSWTVQNIYYYIRRERQLQALEAQGIIPYEKYLHKKALPSPPPTPKESTDGDRPD